MQVRSVAFPNPSAVISASRDATVRLWKKLQERPPTYDGTLASHGSAFVNALSYVPPCRGFDEGLIVSGDRDAIIEVRQPGRSPQDNAEALLLGHSGNVCALDVNQDASYIVSGSWDAEARIWPVGKWQTSAVLKGHQGSVWGVLAYDNETVITACADKLIRVFHISGKLVRTIRGSEDVVRALCRLPSNHPSGAQFASAGNDAVIRLWTLEGKQVATLYGHENFIYSLAALPTGELVSSSEDRTARVWKGTECIQTITHPAISVWSVAACSDNGDIVTGASDRIARVFTRAADRHADAATVGAFDESVKASSIPQQQVGDVNKENLPGPEFLQQKSGTKEGQVQMIKEPNGNVSVHQWSSSANQWINVGTMVDAVGSSGRKVNYQGQDYDYVFDVDIEDGKPPLKLPYNLSSNPYETARKFIDDNELPVSYLDQVANFIVTNTQGASLGQSSGQTQAPGSDPWGTESRYRPGEVGAPTTQQQPAASRPKMLPQTQYLSITTANLATIQKKIQELNKALVDSGAGDVSLSSPEIDILAALTKQLEPIASASSSNIGNAPALNEGIQLAVRLATEWPQDKRLPGLDLLRLLAAATPSTVTVTSSGDKTFVDILATSGVFNPDAPANHTMLSTRALANLFVTDAGCLVVDGEFDKIHELAKPHIDAAISAGAGANRNLVVAIATLYINYAVLLTKSAPDHDADRALTLLDELIRMMASVTDSEGLYRVLVGVGTLLSLGEDFRSAAKEVFEIDQALKKAEAAAKEPRIRNVIKEIKDEMNV